jgi:hypothetical protein
VSAAMKRRLERLEARRPTREVPPTAAERVTAFMRTKYIERYEPEDPPEPFDWNATLERVRRLSIERGHDPDERYW